MCDGPRKQLYPGRNRSYCCLWKHFKKLMLALVDVGIKPGYPKYLCFPSIVLIVCFSVLGSTSVLGDESNQGNEDWFEQSGAQALAYVSMESLIKPRRISYSRKAKEKIYLDYDWQPGVKIRLSYQFTKTKNEDGLPTRTGISGHSILQTSKHARGVRIDNINPVVEQHEYSDHDMLHNLLSQISTYTPAYIVNEDGRLISVIDIEKLRLTMLNEMQETMDGIGSTHKDKVFRLIDTLTSSEQIAHQATQKWNRIVGQWLGAQMIRGVTYPIEYEAPIPMLDNVLIPFRGEYTFLGRTSCHKGDPLLSCVKLQYNSKVDQLGAKLLVQEFFVKMGMPKGQAENIRLYVDYSLELVTDPATLYPYIVKEIKTISTPSSTGLPAVQQMDEKYFVYEYLE